jgi:hypothetical protein
LIFKENKWVTFFNSLIFNTLRYISPARCQAQKRAKLINIDKNIFFFVGAICNLATEFNGLVSTKGWRKPALLLFKHPALSTASTRHIKNSKLLHIFF